MASGKLSNTGLKVKSLFLYKSDIGSSFTTTSVRIGNCANLFGISDYTRVVSVLVSDGAFDPAALGWMSFYFGDVYLATSRSTELSSEALRVTLVYY